LIRQFDELERWISFNAIVRIALNTIVEACKTKFVVNIIPISNNVGVVIYNGVYIVLVNFPIVTNSIFFSGECMAIYAAVID
jgi:hypothetical protein